MKARFLLPLLLTFLQVLSLDAYARSVPGMERFIHSRGVDTTSAAAIVIDLADGSTIASYNEDLPLIPASIMKCVTVASLIRTTGIDYRYATRLFARGEIARGELHGDLIIAGSGDPSLNSTTAPASPDFIRECVSAAEDRGIKHITGRIIADESIFTGPPTPPSWMDADLPHAYGTGCHGINFRNNASGSRSVANPAAVLQSQLKEALKQAGIEVDGEAVSAGGETLLLTHESATIDEIMRSCMMRSDNLYAEALLRTYAVENGEEGSTRKAAEMERKYWQRKHLPMRGIEIVDGSGLSRDNRLTARFLAEVLKDMSDNVDYVSFFPLAGQDGTLRNFLKDSPLDSYIALKTGSMKGIQCYAGYKLDDYYAPTHVVVVMVNNMPQSRGAARSAVADMLLSIFGYGYLNESPENETDPTQ